MSEGLQNFIASYRGLIEDTLRTYLPLSSRSGAQRLNEAIEYAVFPGGKRIRPALTLIATSLTGNDLTRALPAACGIEFLHTSSIILDDLPSMDDAGLRRGRHALHLVFGEDTALLAALSLLNRSYALFALSARESENSDAIKRLIEEASRAIGSDGMIGGQAADLELRAENSSVESLATRNLKTTALMRLTMIAGAIACGGQEEDISALAIFGDCLGAAYQIHDDLIDEIYESDVTGKTARQDARHLRSNFASELGVEGANNLALSLIEQGKSAIIDRFESREEAALLINAADMIVSGFCTTDFLVNTARLV